MDSADSATNRGRRTWLLVMAVAWGLLGIWNISADQAVLGAGQLALAGVSLAAALSSRVAALVDAPVFRRK